MSLTALLAPQRGDAWRSTPTTLVLGRHDDLNPKELQDWACNHFDDVRIIESDHFIPLRLPDTLADIIAGACEQQRSGTP
jgi:pimeloyl-ACP methyl ester carboxylesterase